MIVLHLRYPPPVIAATLVAYLAVLLGVGVWAQRRVGDTADFHLGGRRLGPVVAALSASASSSSAWTLLGVSGAAYAWGLQAVWLVPAVISGFAINWYLVAPRLQSMSREGNALTLVQFLTRGTDARTAWRMRVLGAAVILFCFVFYIAAQFQAAGAAISTALPVSPATAMIAGAVVVVVYVFLGGFWAASVTDAVQGLMMLFVALVLPVVALMAVGGPAALWEGLAALGEPSLLRVVDQPGLLLTLVFVAGLFGIGLGYPGQPHVVNRFMAMRSGDEVGFARRLALTWAVMIYVGMVILGWSGRVLLPELADPESALTELTVGLLPAVLGGLVTGGVLAAIMSTVDSQLLVAGSAVSHDLRRGRDSVALDRAVVLVLGVGAVILALYFPSTIFRRVLFAWQVLGNAFGPLLLVLLWRGRVAAPFRLAAMLTGAVATVLLSVLPDAPGDAVERLAPFFVALAIALAGTRERLRA
ncbi:MAG: sodium/proline symporter [Thermoanaerobaculia bacterium]